MKNQLQGLLREALRSLNAFEDRLTLANVADKPDYIRECEDIRRSLRSMHIALEKDAR